MHCGFMVWHSNKIYLPFDTRGILRIQSHSDIRTVMREILSSKFVTDNDEVYSFRLLAVVRTVWLDVLVLFGAMPQQP